MLELKNLKKYYKIKKDEIIEVLKGISLKFDDKGMTFILGKSGSGKTTLLNLIGGLDKSTRGDIIINGKNMNSFSEKDYISYRNNYVGFIFQDYNNIEEYTVLENILLGINIQNKKIDNKDLENLLNDLGIYKLKNRKMNELSGGEKQRVAIARAILKDSKRILADEPTGNLDSKNGKNIMELLKKLSKTRLVIVVTHDIEFAKTYADRIIEIKDGSVINDTGILNDFINKSYQSKKTRIPLKDIIKLSFLSFKNRKGKCFITSVLMAFTIFFLSFSYLINTYDKDKVHFKLLKNNNITNVEIKKINNNDEEYQETNINNDDIKFFNNNIKELFNKVYNITEPNLIDALNLKIIDNPNIFYQTDYKIDIVELNNQQNSIDKIIGKYPSNDDEIIISNYLADLMIKFGTYDNNKLYQPKDYEQIVNDKKKIKFGKYNYVKVVGIINYDLSKYNSLKKQKEIQTSNQNLYDDFNKDIEYLYNKIYVNKDFINNLNLPKDISLDNSNQYIIQLSNGYPVNNIDILNKEIEYYDGTTYKKTNNLKPNEVIINLSSLIKDDKTLKQQVEKYKNNSKELKNFIVDYLKLNNYIGSEVKLNIYENKSQIYNIKLENPSKTIDNLKVIGITGFDLNDTKTYVDSNHLTNYLDNYIKIKSIIAKTNYHNIVNLPKNNNYIISTKYTDIVNNYYQQLNQFKTFFLILIIIFLLFSTLLIYNFMINSIDDRKKDIGILKSLGANNYSITEIFLCESILLSIISSFITYLFISITILIVNKISLVPFLYSDVNVIYIIILYPLFLTIICSVVPIKKLLKKEVVDLIYNRTNDC